MPLLRRYSGDDGAPDWWISPVLSAWVLSALMIFGLVIVAGGLAWLIATDKISAADDCNFDPKNPDATAWNCAAGKTLDGLGLK